MFLAGQFNTEGLEAKLFYISTMSQLSFFNVKDKDPVGGFLTKTVSDVF